MKIRNYRLFASGQVISLTGTWMQRVAQDWLVLVLSGSSGVALGLVTALQFLPTLLFGLWGGILADRYDKRLLLIAAQTAMGLQALLLGMLTVSGAVQLWHVYVLAVALGLTNAIETPTRQSFVVEMVGADDLPNAVGLNAATFNSARIVGPAVAGVLINWTGVGPVFLINAASTIAVLAGLALMRASDLMPAPRAGREKGQLAAGLAYVRSRSDLVVPMVLVFVVATFGMNFQITLALMAKVVFGRGAGSFGLLSTAFAVGALAGALTGTLRKRRPRIRFLLVAAFGFGVADVLVGLMPTYWSLAGALVLAGAAALTFMVGCNAAVQMGVASTMRGRVMALYLMCFLGGVPLGAPIVGAVAEEFGPRVSILTGGTISALAAIVVGLVLAHRRGLAVRDVAHEVTAELREVTTGALRTAR